MPQTTTGHLAVGEIWQWGTDRHGLESPLGASSRKAVAERERLVTRNKRMGG